MSPPCRGEEPRQGRYFFGWPTPWELKTHLNRRTLNERLSRLSQLGYLSVVITKNGYPQFCLA